MRHPANHIFDHTPDTLRAWCVERGLPAFRAAQALDWVYAKGVADPLAMTNLAKRDRDLLAAEMTFLSGEAVRHQSASDGTEKLLVEWADYREIAKQRDSEAGDGARGASQGHGAQRASEGLSLPLQLSSSPLKPQASGLKPSTDRQTECVMIPADARDTRSAPRRTACISSQVGCPVGCRFCASGLGGLDGNLSAGRIVEQVWRLNSLLSSPSTS
ncbi:MAG: hypothetical protein KJZ54_15780, partial [Phycisphaerales bacterium]|nr:hypothetical protein [Phycisphaerales bacterium]